MTDQSTTALPPVPEASAKVYAGLSAESQATAHGQLKAAGFDVSKLSVGVVTAPAAAADAPTAPKADAVNTQRWLDLYKNFTGDKTQVIAAALKSNVDIVALEASAKTAPIIQQQKVEASLAAALEAPANASDYRIDFGRHAADMDNIEAFNKELTAGFLKVGVPQSLASGLAQSFIESEKMYRSQLDPRLADADDIAKEQVAIQSRMHEEGSKIRALQGGAEVVRLAAIGEQALRMAMGDGMYNAAAFHTANAQSQLAALGRVIEAKKK